MKRGAADIGRARDRFSAALLRRATWLLLGAVILPNLGALSCRFVYDDFPWIVDNPTVHALGRLGGMWSSSLWPSAGALLVRPVTLTFWTLLWVLGGGEPWVFHLFNLVLAAAVVLLLHRLFLVLELAPVVAFVAAALFALFPIHTEATTAAFGAAELLAAALSLGAVNLFLGGWRATALLLFAAALLAKESAAVTPVLAAIVLRTLRRPLKPYWPDGLAATALVTFSVLAHRVAFTAGHGVSVLDNPAAPAGLPVRLATALWVQCLYIGKTFLPLRLSADYSFNQLPPITGLDDPRAWAGLALVACGLLIAALQPPLRTPLLLYAVLFLPTANILFAIGTIMGERLVYLPSAGLALLAALLLTRNRHWPIVLALVAFFYAGRTALRNLDWRGAETMYPNLVLTAPKSARSHYLYGDLLAYQGDDEGAIRAYDRSIAIYPSYGPVHFNRGNALTRLGRIEEAKKSYQLCVDVDPALVDAARMLEFLRTGIPVVPKVLPF